jgi:hypothetical protein
MCIDFSTFLMIAAQIWDSLYFLHIITMALISSVVAFSNIIGIFKLTFSFAVENWC